MVEPAEILGTRHTVSMLLYVMRKEEVNSMDFRHLTKNWSTTAERLNMLVEAGLLNKRIVEEGHISARYSLSPKGYFVTRLLKICDDTIKGNFDFENSSLNEYLDIDPKTYD